VAGIPLTLYGKGTQRRSFLNIRDTLRCVELAVLHPPDPGEFRVFNQFTEIFSLRELASLVKQQGQALGLTVQIQHLENPRVEAEEHYYNARHQKLIDLGLEPHCLSDVLIGSMLRRIQENAHRIRCDSILPRVHWDHTASGSHRHAAARVATRETNTSASPVWANPRSSL
jgi:UDP-sulfoquinovose synthase